MSSTAEQKVDSSLNNLPERHAAQPTTKLGSNDTATSPNTQNNSIEEKVPIDKHGDTWGGGIPHENKQFK